MKNRWALLALTSFVMAASAAPERGAVDLKAAPALTPHYQAEFTLDSSADPAQWSKQPSGLRVAFASTDERVFRCDPPALPSESQVWTGSGWRGERLSAQILVWSADAQEQVRLECSDLRNEEGMSIDRSNLRPSLVRYVLSNYPYEATGFTCDVTNDRAFLMPDRLEPFERFDLPARTVRPVWLSLDLPADAAPGLYSGTVRVRSVTGDATLRLTVRVASLLLPKPHDWQFRLDLWQNPWVVSSHFQVAPWSKEHLVLLREHLKLYAEAGGTYITTYCTHSPWSDNSYTLEGTMIEWIKKAGGGWKFDYSIFDQYVELAMSVGIDRAITIYTPVPWGHRFRYLDEASGQYLSVKWSPDTGQFRDFWRVFLDDLKQHLSQKGWLQKTYLGINENPLDVTLAAVKVIKEHSADWKITYAGDWHPELASVLDDYSVIITREPNPEELKARAARGLSTTYYVCCNPPRPNNFVFSAPVESRFNGWYAAAYGYNGFLRWAYDAWPADPNRDARHTLWPAGDCFLVYPGASSSVRFEKLREGIADAEKIRLLRQWTGASPNARAKELLRDLDRHLASMVAERDYAKRDYTPATVKAAVDKGVTIIEQLSRELSRR